MRAFPRRGFRAFPSATLSVRLLGVTQHAHSTCIVCGGRLGRAWLKKAPKLPRRWGYLLDSYGRRQIRKVGDFPLGQTARADVMGWLGPYAEMLAALATSAVADLLVAGWPIENLQRLVVTLRLHGFMERVVEYVYVQSPTIAYGTAQAAGYQFAGDVRAELPTARVASFTVEEDD